MKEEEFWHCLRRLTQAAEDDAVLLGGGATEQWCAHWLMSHQCCAGIAASHKHTVRWDLGWGWWKWGEDEANALVIQQLD